MPTTSYTLSLHDALPIFKYVFDNTVDRKAALDYLKGGNSKPSDIDVEAGHKLTVTFASQSATLPDGQSSVVAAGCPDRTGLFRSEEHTSELQSLRHLVCRLRVTLFPYTTLFRSSNTFSIIRWTARRRSTISRAAILSLAIST